MDQHLSENEMALQTLRVALKDLEAAAKVYQDQLRSKKGGRPKSVTDRQNVLQPETWRKYQGQSDGLHVLDLARKLWQRVIPRHRS